MYGVTLLIAASTLGVDYGWQPVEGESLEYIIQIEPELVAALEAGEAITSEIPADVQGVRRFRIQIGEAALPQVEHDPLAGGASGEPTPAQPPAEEGPFVHGDHTHADPADADHPPIIQPPPRRESDGGSMYGSSGGASMYGEGSSIIEGGSPASESSEEVAEEVVEEEGSIYGSETEDATASSEFYPPRTTPPPPAPDRGNLFGGSGEMFGGSESVADASGGTTPAPPATLPADSEGPEIELPLLEPPGGEATESELAETPTPPATLSEPGPSPFRQPGQLNPPQPAGELTGFEAEEETAHDDHDHVAHEEQTEEEEPASPSAAADYTPQEPANAEEAGRPWLPLTLTLLLLFASIGANVYLGWILLETLARYRRLQTDQAG